MCPSDYDYWLSELERRAAWLEEELRAWRNRHRQEPDSAEVNVIETIPDELEPDHDQVWAFVNDQLIPEIDRALGVYEAGGTQIMSEVYAWQVGLLSVIIVIRANADGVVINSTMPWIARKLYNHYTHLGYIVEPLNHQDDHTMQRPTRVRICRRPAGAVLRPVWLAIRPPASP